MAAQRRGVEFHVAQLIDAAVAGDGLGQLVVSGLDEFVNLFGGQGVLDPETGQRGLGSQGDE